MIARAAPGRSARALAAMRGQDRWDPVGPGGSMVRDWTGGLTWTLALLILIGTGWRRVEGPDFRRPIEGDEAISLEHYTWVGVEPDGKRHRLRRMADYYGRRAPGLKLGAIGAYCSLGRWPEPNNHIVNSLMMNLSVALGPRTESSARLPALAFALLFGDLFVQLCGVYLGSRASALPVLAGLLWCPYLDQFSQEACGYSATLALEAVLLLAASRLVRKPASIFWGGLCASLAILTFLNVVNLAVAWILPLYLTLLVFPFRARSGEPIDEGAGLRSLRRNLVVQGLGIGVAGFLFLMSHLPAVISSMQQYGLSVTSAGELIRRVGQAVDDLFPRAAWKGVAFAGVVGLGLCGRSDRRRFLAILAAITLAVGLTHFAGSRRFPYSRTLGYFLPFVFLGVANLVRLSIEAARTSRRRAVTWAIWAGASAALIAPSLGGTIGDPGRLAILRSVETLPPSGGGPVYSLMAGDIQFDSLGKYLPTGWLDEYDPLPPGGPVELALFYRDAGGEGVRTRRGRGGASSWDPVTWARRPVRATGGPFRFLTIPGRSGPLDEAGDGRALVFWYPDFRSVAVTPRDVLDFVEASGPRYLTRAIRQQVKLDIFGLLDAVVLISATPEDLEVVRRTVAEGARRFGGRSVSFRPDPAAPEAAVDSGNSPLSSGYCLESTAGSAIIDKNRLNGIAASSFLEAIACRVFEVSTWELGSVRSGQGGCRWLPIRAGWPSEPRRLLAGREVGLRAFSSFE